MKGEIFLHKIARQDDPKLAEVIEVLDQSIKDVRFHVKSCDDDDVKMRSAIEARVAVAFACNQEIWTAGEKEGDIGCVAIWASPDETGGIEIKKEIMGRFMASLSEETKRWMEAEHERGAASKDLVDKTNSYHLSLIGTLSTQRGKGLAKALVETLVERAQKEGRAVHLVCTDRRTTDGFYTKVGFKTVYERKLVYHNGEEDVYCLMVHKCESA